MRQLFRALALFFRSRLTWRACRIASQGPRYHVVARDGFLFVEPRVPQ